MNLKISIIVIFVLIAFGIGCTGSEVPSTPAAQPTVDPTIAASVPSLDGTAVAMPGLLPQGFGCDEAWDWGAIREAYPLASSPTGYAADILIERRTHAGAPRDYSNCYSSGYGTYIFVKEEVPITEEAYRKWRERQDRKLNRIDLLPPGWETIPEPAFGELTDAGWFVEGESAPIWTILAPYHWTPLGLPEPQWPFHIDLPNLGEITTDVETTCFGSPEQCQ